jgi:uncharacterized protein
MSKFVVHHPRVIIAAVILLAAASIFGLRRGLVLDVSPLTFVERGSREELDFTGVRKEFGPDDYLVVAVVCDDVFAPANIARLRILHKKIEQTRGVSEVLSPVNVPAARSVDGVVQVVKLISNTSEEGLAEARSLGTSDRLYRGNLVSPDARTAAFNILLKTDLPTNIRHVITGQIYDHVRNSGFDQRYFAGDPFSQWRSTEAIKSDLRIFLPLTLLLIAVLLWLCFRSFVAVALPLGTIGIGLLWLMGLMAVLNAHFTILALMLPTLMLAIGCSYMIHVVNQIGIVSEKRKQETDKAKLLEEALRFINLPVIVSALTIIAGFLSLSFTKIPAIRTTAIFAAIGAVFTMILALTFIPAILVLLPRRAIVFRVGLDGGMVRLLEQTGRWATSHQPVLYILTAVIVMVSVIGVRRIEIDIDYFHFFKPNSETSIGLDEVSKRLSGAVSFDLIIEGKNAGAIENSHTLRRIAELQAFAEEQRDPSSQGIDHTISVADFVKHINRAFHDNDPQHYSIPADEHLIQELLTDRGQVQGFLSSDGRMTRVLIRSNLTGSQAMASVIREIEDRGRELLPDFRVFATGTFVLLNRTSDQIGGEQVKSVMIALVAIYFMLSILFRSPRVGLTALVPNLIPVLFFFGFMGWVSVPLNLTTSLVASVVLGLAVDNSVQFIVRFRRLQAETTTMRGAIIQSMRMSGRPIIYANIALAAAFAVFSISSFGPIGTFGLLSAVTIIGCLVEDLLLLPARLTSPLFRCVESRRVAQNLTVPRDIH